MPAWFGVVDTPAQERLLAAWPDAPVDNLETCGMLLEVARDQVWAYAPESVDAANLPVVVPTDTTVPARLVYAQLQQASSLWDAGRVSSSGDTGGDTFTFTPRPMDKVIRTIIRPMAVPSAG